MTRLVGCSKIIEQESGATVSQKDLIWDGTQLLEEQVGGATTKQYFRQGVKIGADNYLYTRDHLGSVRELLTPAGTVAARYDYGLYGKNPAGYAGDGRRLQASGTIDADIGYTGHYFSCGFRPLFRCVSCL